jgi:hypothetical protein
MEAAMAERLKALKEGEWGNFFGNSSPKCPHCGYDCDVSAHDLYRVYEEGEHEIDCPSCGLEFTVSTRVSFSFSTEDQEEL